MVRIILFSLSFFSNVFLSGLKAQQVGEGEGTVYLMRRTGYNGSLDGYSIFMDGQLICVLNNNKYTVHKVPAGKHDFSIQFNGKQVKDKTEKLEVEVSTNGEYYINVEQRNGWATVKVKLQELAGSSGKRAMEDVVRDDSCR